MPEFDIRCIGCGLAPDDITQYRCETQCGNCDVCIWGGPVEYVKEFEETYNPLNGHFACGECYAGMDIDETEEGWVAP